MDPAFFPPSLPFEESEENNLRKRNREAVEEEEKQLLDRFLYEEMSIPFNDLFLLDSPQSSVDFFDRVPIKKLLKIDHKYNRFFAYAVAVQKEYGHKTFSWDKTNAVLKVEGNESNLTSFKLENTNAHLTILNSKQLTNSFDIYHTGDFGKGELLHPQMLQYAFELHNETPIDELFETLYEEIKREGINKENAKLDFKRAISRTNIGIRFMADVFLICTPGEGYQYPARDANFTRNLATLYGNEDFVKKLKVVRVVIYVSYFVNELVKLISERVAAKSIKIKADPGFQIELFKNLNKVRAAVPKALFLLSLAQIKEKILDPSRARYFDFKIKDEDIDVRLYDSYLGNSMNRDPTRRQALSLRAMYYSMGLKKDTDEGGLHGSYKDIKDNMNNIIIREI